MKHEIRYSFWTWNSSLFPQAAVRIGFLLAAKSISLKNADPRRWAIVVIIAIAAVLIRYRQHKQEKNAFFGELEGEYDEENLLDDDDWAGLGDFGDATFGGDNPMYGGAVEADRADNEM